LGLGVTGPPGQADATIDTERRIARAVRHEPDERRLRRLKARRSLGGDAAGEHDTTLGQVGHRPKYLVTGIREPDVDPAVVTEGRVRLKPRRGCRCHDERDGQRA
jgi:hypothetical protein